MHKVRKNRTFDRYKPYSIKSIDKFIQVKENSMDTQEMIEKIQKFIDMYFGTAIGESIRRKLDNARLDNYDDVEKIYEEVMEM